MLDLAAPRLRTFMEFSAQTLLAQLLAAPHRQTKDAPKNGRGLYGLGSGLIDHSQKMTVAAMQMADMKVWAQRS